MSSHLQYLGLDRDADELAVKRAYARKLKQIDQERDPVGFQMLREAYEGASRWVRHHGAIQPEVDMRPGEDACHEQGPDEQARNEQMPQEQACDEPACQEQVPEPGESIAANPHLAAVHQPETAQQERADPTDSTDATASPAVSAQEVFSEFTTALAAALPNISQVRGVLKSAIEDPRLIRVEARDLFEWYVAELLAYGWRPGHDCLLETAADQFNWQKDRRRLLRLDWVGAKLDRAIQEMNAFFRHQQYWRQMDLIRALHTPERPGSGRIADCLPVLEELARRYPVLFPLITSEENLERWRAWFNEVNFLRRRLGRSRARRFWVQRAPRQATVYDGIPGTVFILAIVVLTYLFSAVTMNPTVPRVPSQSGMPQPHAAQGAPAPPPGAQRHIDAKSPPATSDAWHSPEALLAAEPNTRVCAELEKMPEPYPPAIKLRIEHQIINCAFSSLWPGGADEPRLRAALGRLLSVEKPVH